MLTGYLRCTEIPEESIPEAEFQVVEKKKRKPKEPEKGQKGTKRPIIIDGLNIAKTFGNHLYGTDNKLYSSKGLIACYEYFKKRKYDDKLITIVLKHIPDHLWDNKEILEDLRQKKIVVDARGRTLNNERMLQDDDTLALDIAKTIGGIIVTCDFYRNHFDRATTYRDVIQYRLLQPTYFHEEITFHPEPNGSSGPKLKDILLF